MKSRSCIALKNLQSAASNMHLTNRLMQSSHFHGVTHYLFTAAEAQHAPRDDISCIPGLFFFLGWITASLHQQICTAVACQNNENMTRLSCVHISASKG